MQNGEQRILKRGDEIELTIDDAAFEGKSVGRIEGFVVFVDGAVPGDVVRAPVLKRRVKIVN